MSTTNSKKNIHSLSEKAEFLEIANQQAIKAIHQLQMTIEKSEAEMADLAKLNQALFAQVDQKHKLKNSNTAYTEKANQMAIKEINRLQDELKEKNSALDELGFLNHKLFNQTEEKNGIIFKLEEKIISLKKHHNETLLVKTSTTKKSTNRISNKKAYNKKIATQLAVQNKQISILRRTLLSF